MLRNQRGELVFMSTRKQNFIGCKWCSKYSDNIGVEDPRSA